MRAEATAVPRRSGDRARLDLAPDLGAWAVTRGPAQPLLAEHHPGTAYWRELALDPGLSGVKPGRGTVTELSVGSRARPDLWKVPVTGVLGDPVWHPHLPLVAGLTVRAREARPWIADHERRTVTVYEHVRAATSLSELGPHRRAPLAWCGGKLLMLVPAAGPREAAGQATEATGPVLPSPLVFDAVGPGHVEFEPGLDELAALAAARVAALDPADGVAVPLTGPLLVRELSVPDGGGPPLVEHAAGEPGRSGLRWSVRTLDPATGRLDAAPEQSGTTVRSAGARVSAVLDGTVLRLTVDGQVHRLPLPEDVARLGRPVPAEHDGHRPARLVIDCASADGRTGLVVVDVSGPSAGVVWTPAPDSGAGRVLSVRAADRGGSVELVVQRAGGVGHFVLRGDRLEPVGTPIPDVAALALRAAPATHLSVAGGTLSLTDGTRREPRGPMVLWLQADEPGTRPRPGAVPRSLTWTGHECCVLRLPLRWPADASADELRGQVADAVEAALGALDEHAGGRFDGRVVVGGHSFAATLALVALAAIPRLAGAVAHSGCYNRTLTPTGFQFERRPYWAVPEVYEAFSALLFAHRLDRPVLIVHGTEDTNRATPPEQALELYRAIVATGGRARLVLLPYEGHTYVHAETHRHLADAQREWLESWREPGRPGE